MFCFFFTPKAEGHLIKSKSSSRTMAFKGWLIYWLSHRNNQLHAYLKVLDYRFSHLQNMFTCTCVCASRAYASIFNTSSRSYIVNAGLWIKKTKVSWPTLKSGKNIQTIKAV